MVGRHLWFQVVNPEFKYTMPIYELKHSNLTCQQFKASELFGCGLQSTVYTQCMQKIETCQFQELITLPLSTSCPTLVLHISSFLIFLLFGTIDK